MKIVNARTGENHVTAELQAKVYQSILGSGNLVLNFADNLRASTLSDNSVEISGGVACAQGRLCVVEENEPETLIIENGMSGYTRHDLIVVHVERATDKTESVELRVIKGTPVVEGVPEDPDYIVGDYNNGDNVTEMPLYRVVKSGLAITDVVDLFELVKNTSVIAEIEKGIPKLSLFTSVASSTSTGGSTATESYIVPEDGFLKITYRPPSGGLNVTVYLTNETAGGSDVSLVSSFGASVSGVAPVAKGYKYKGNASQAGTVTLSFMPLRTE